jgi:hypothetical protein
MHARREGRARRSLRAATRLSIVALCLLAGSDRAIALTADIEQGLKSSRYVYISSNRKDGSFGAPAEIWFMYHKGAVWVASPQTTWRVRRIKANRPQAKIAVGKADGPTFTATGTIVTDSDINETLMKSFASKYPGGWQKWEKGFREGLANGKRVVVRYTPVD